MSKRFGRNQRRKLREVIGALGEAMAMDRALLRRQADRIEKQAMVIRDIAARLDEHFAPLGIKEIRGRFDTPIRWAAMHVSAPDASSEMQFINMIRTILDVRMTDDDCANLRAMIRLSVVDLNRPLEACYVISHKELFRSGLDERFVREWLAPHIAEKITRSINEKIGRP